MLPTDLKVTHAIAQVNGLRYHYVEKGAGPLLLLLHGFPESWWGWRYQLDALADAGFRVVAPDQRGYNGTDRKGPYDLDTLCADVAALIATLGEQKAHVVGHDWGGAVAFHLAATRPEVVDKVAALGCPHPAKLVEALRTRRKQQLRSAYQLLFQVPFVPEQVLARFSHVVLPFLYRRIAQDPTHFSNDELRPFIEAARKPGAASAMFGWYRAAFQSAWKRRGKGQPYPPIHAEALLLWAMNDVALGYDELVPGTERWAPKLQVKTLERCGHFLHEEQPERVNEALLAFLGQPARGAEREKPATAKSPREVTVVLSDAGENLIGVIKEVRAITGLDLRNVRELVETTPATLKEHVAVDEAERIQRQLAAAGAKVELR